MSHETVIKVKHRGVFVNAEDLSEIRDAERAGPPLPEVDFRRLPRKSSLDKDSPIEQLFFEHPEVRNYITEPWTDTLTGVTVPAKIRQGLRAKDRKKAEQILEKYGGQ